MTLRWRNGLLHIGHLPFVGGWGLELAWNRREDLNDPPSDGETIFADYKCLAWWRGQWWPRYSSYAMHWKL